MESLRSSVEGKAVGTEAHSSSHKFDRILRMLESSHPSIHLYEKEIEEEFNKLIHTPDHPPYASMIQRAITELNEQEGSSEETISKFIEAEYEDLPTAHSSQLTHHLQKLLAKGEIACTSKNCYILSLENCDLLHNLKKEQKHSRGHGRGRKKCRQNKAKGAKSQKEQKIEERQELNELSGKIFEGINQQNQTEREIESLVEQTEQGHAELIEEQNVVEESQFKAIEEQDNDGNEERNLMQEQQYQQQNLVLRQTIEVLVVEKNQAEESNSAANHNEITEAENQKELEEEVTEEQKNEKLEEENQIKDQEREAREEPVQLPEVHIEAMVGQIDTQAEHFEVSEEEKRLQEQQMDVCCQIIDLSNTLVHFIKKEKENKATKSSQNVDFFYSSHLTKEEFMELLKKTNKIQERLIDIINMEMSENNNSDPAIRRHQELLAEHLRQTRNPGKGQPQLEQQLEACGQLKVPEYQPKTTPPPENDVPADSVQLEQRTQNEPPSHKMQPEDKTTLDELVAKQSEQIKLRAEQEATKSQPMSTVVSLDGPHDSPHDTNENTQMVIQRENVPEDNSHTLEEKMKSSRDANMSTPETEKSYLVVFIEEQLQNSRHCGPEKLPTSELVTSSPNVLQEPSLEHQQQTTSNNETKGPEYKQQEENPAEVHRNQTQEEMQRQSQPCSVTKQCEQSKGMLKKYQRRKLRPRIPRPSKCDPVVLCVEDDHNLTIASVKSEMNKKLKLSTLKRPREPSPRTLVEVSHSRGQQKKDQCQQKRLKSHPTVDSAITSLQQMRQLRPRGKGSSLSELVFLQPGQHEQEQSKPQGRGRPPKLRTNADSKKKQPSHQGRGRPPKSKLAAASKQA